MAGEMAVGVGETVVVRVPEVMSGHVWTVVEMGDGLILAGDRYDGGGDGAPGQGAEHVFEVRAVRVGEWVVRLRLAREWETAGIDERVLTVRVA